ncbi:MAG TPA: DUF2480 family protein, partial [Flavisolibacter sp.]|nr:DUF2480 family protein [Flavisolibacter sp.]
MSEVFVNKVANSGLITLDLENYLPEGEMVTFDIAAFLFMGLILKEKDFRESLKNLDWSQYQDKNVAIICSVDAIIPVWAYMLIAVYLEPVANNIFTGSIDEMYKHLFLKNIESIPVEDYRD